MAPRRRTFWVVLLALASLSVTPFPEKPRLQVEATAGSRSSGVDAEVTQVTAFLKSRSMPLTGAEIEQLASVIVEESRRAGFESAVVLAVIEVESSGDHTAVSKVGARGLMQLRPATAQAVAEQNGFQWNGELSLFDPELNVRLGVRYLETLVDRFGELPLALAAYNWGPTYVAARVRRGEVVPAAYAQRVLSAYDLHGRSTRRAI